jgi:hypothetical protein
MRPSSFGVFEKPLDAAALLDAIHAIRDTTSPA